MSPISPNKFLEKIRTGIWFLLRPRHWLHAVALVTRKFRTDNDTPDKRSGARAWAATRAVTVSDALSMLGLKGDIASLPSDLMAEGQERASRSAVSMGGPGDIDLLYNAVRLSDATRVVETGVAYGWSSLAILAAVDEKSRGRLVSVDMPYPKMGNEKYVGIVVPERFRSRWEVVREPDRRGLIKALRKLNGQIDLCHYDSDKSWWGRAYAFPILWAALRPGGLFISDDIQDNMYFAGFAKEKGAPFAVTEFENKFVGVIRKKIDQ